MSWYQTTAIELKVGRFHHGGGCLREATEQANTKINSVLRLLLEMLMRCPGMTGMCHLGSCFFRESIAEHAAEINKYHKRPSR